jgi:hypothetical protein
MTEDAAVRRRRRAADVARCRSRQRRGVALFEIEVGTYEYELARLYGGLREDQVDDKQAVSAALGRLLRRALASLIREKPRR